MTQWMAWSALFTALVALGALGVERAAALMGGNRRFVWMIAIVATAVVPVMVASRVAPSVERPPMIESPAVVSDAIDAPVVDRIAEPAMQAIPTSAWHWRDLVTLADRWIGLAWVGTSMVWFAWLVGAVVRLRRRRNSWHEVETDAGCVFVSNDDGPAVVGFVHPRIVIPRWALVADRGTRELLLLHEREHLRANDSRVLFGAAVVLAVFPWNAALWWMSRRLRLAIEIDCDARVIRASGAPHSYGHMLLSVGERYVSRMLPASAFLTESGTHLEARIDAMTTPRARRPLAAALPFACAACAVLTTAAWTPVPPPFRVAPQLRTLETTPTAQPATVIAPVTTTVISKPTTLRIEQPAIAAPVIIAPQIAVVEVEDPKPLRGNPAPRYPDSLRTVGAEGHVFMKFSTNAQGVPDTSTIQVLDASDDLFTESVRRVLPRVRYDSEGLVRYAVYFRAPDSGRETPVPIVEGVAVMPVIVTATMLGVRRDTVQQQTPARRQFDRWLDAFNSPDASRLDEFNKQFSRKDPQRDPTGEKGSASLANMRVETGGFDILAIRRSQPTSLEFVARKRAGDKATRVGYFAIAALDNPRIESFRTLLVQPWRSVDDPALIEHLQNMRP